MPDFICGSLRIWNGEPEPTCGTGLPERARGGSRLVSLAERLARDELLRSLPHDDHPPEPLSLQWYLNIEALRQQRQGHWLARILEYSRHTGERLLGLGGALGTDWVQYAKHGAEVIGAYSCADRVALVRRHFELRGLSGTFLHASPTCLPLDSASIDVACVLGLLHEQDNPEPLIDEVYRVLKPGGKVIAVVPARYGVEYWTSWVPFAPRRKHQSETGNEPDPGLLSPAARRFTSRQMHQLFGRFQEARLYKRHLRRSEVPHLWRWLPLSLLERLMGRLLIFKAFKPVSAAIGSQMAA